MRTDAQKEYRAALIALNDAAYVALRTGIKIGIKAEIDDLRLVARITDDFMDMMEGNDD